MRPCPNCGAHIDSAATKCKQCYAAVPPMGWNLPRQTAPSPALLKLKRVALFIFLVFLAIALVSFMAPYLWPSCVCSLDSGCQGCGGTIGNALAHFALLGVAFGAMGLVLLLWYGVPIFIVCFLIFLLYNFFKSDEDSTKKG